MTTKRCGCAAVSMGRKIYVMGGYDGSDSFSSVEVFSPSLRQWISLPPMQTKRSGCAAVSIGGQIYVLGGYDGSNYLLSVEFFSPASKQWTSLPSMTTKRGCCAAVSMGGQIYVMGGYDGSKNCSSVEVFSPSLRQWASLPPMQTKRSRYAAVSMGGQIHAVGGYTGSNYLSSVEVFSPSSRQWTSLPPMHFKRIGCAAVSIGEQTYVMGGYDGSSYLSSVEVLCVQPVEVLHVQHDSSEVCARRLARTSLKSDITSQQQMTRQCSTPMYQRAGSQADQLPFPSQMPQTFQLLQSKIPTANFIPVASEVVTVEDASVSQSAAEAATSLTQHLTNATTEGVCQWLARNGISKTSLDILQQEDFDGSFLFEESSDEIKNVLKEEGMSAGQISRIRRAVEKAKREGYLN
eukprot:13071522-Ditylum_brightwellii.AAC.1